MTESAITMDNPDFLGAFGGRLALAFGAGCIACWAFIAKFIIDPRIRALEDENMRCNERVQQLEGFLFFHGSGEMRQAMQKSLSEEHIDRLEADNARSEKS